MLKQFLLRTTSPLAVGRASRMDDVEWDRMSRRIALIGRTMYGKRK